MVEGMSSGRGAASFETLGNRTRWGGWEKDKAAEVGGAGICRSRIGRLGDTSALRFPEALFFFLMFFFGRGVVVASAGCLESPFFLVSFCP